MNGDMGRLLAATAASSSTIEEILDVNLPDPAPAAREYLEALKRARRSRNSVGQGEQRLKQLIARFSPLRIQLEPSMARGQEGSVSGYVGDVDAWALELETRQGSPLSPEDVQALDALQIQVSRVGQEWWVEIVSDPLPIGLQVSLDGGESWLSPQTDELDEFVMVARVESRSTLGGVLLRSAE